MCVCCGGVGSRGPGWQWGSLTGWTRFWKYCCLTVVQAAAGGTVETSLLTHSKSTVCIMMCYIHTPRLASVRARAHTHRAETDVSWSNTHLRDVWRTLSFVLLPFPILLNFFTMPMMTHWADCTAYEKWVKNPELGEVEKPKWSDRKRIAKLYSLILSFLNGRGGGQALTRQPEQGYVSDL